MNILEKEMLSLLKNGKNTLGFTHVRAEFEAEGIRDDELLRLVELSFRADLDLIIKIGGCEAITDLMKAKQLGATTIIAPMIESSYAVSKFVQSIERLYPDQERADVEFFINIETIQGYEQSEAIADSVANHGLTGIVFGRVDFCGSLGMNRRDVNKPEITRRVKDIALLCQAKALKFIVGGGVDAESVPVLRDIQSAYLDRYETRKIAFDLSTLGNNLAQQGLIEASRFELLWLKNKCNYYKAMSCEDQHRLKLLERRIISLAA